MRAVKRARSVGSAVVVEAPASVTAAADEGATFLREVEAALRQAADAQRAASSSKYMRELFPFLGVATPTRRERTKPLLGGWRGDFDDLARDVRALWSLPEREFQYVAIDLLSGQQRLLTGAARQKRGRAESPPTGQGHDADSALQLIEELIRSKSWWDTVDLLASNSLGQLVASHPRLVDVMDEWNKDEHLWIRRSTLLYQLKYKAPDQARLFRYVASLQHDSDFFIRKAIGWALRSHSRLSDAANDAVRQLLARDDLALSPLSVREASKYLKQ